MADSLIQEDNQSSEREAVLAKWKDKTPAEVLAAKVESDLYIKSLTTRFDDLSKDYMKLREDHQASTDLKTLIETMKKERENPDTSSLTRKEEPQTAIKPEDIKSLIAQELTQHQRQSQQQENFKTVQGKLKEVYGDNYVNTYKQRLDQLGITSEYADELAKTQPKLFFKTFDLDNPVVNKSMNNPTISQQRSTFNPSTQKRDWNYYQELKKSNPKMYLDPKIAIQMHNDAIELGAAFGMPED